MAHCTGKGLKFGAGKKTDAYIENWSRADELFRGLRLDAPASYEVAVVYDARDDSAGR